MNTTQCRYLKDKDLSILGAIQSLLQLSSVCAKSACEC